jgi:hypothetical protein
VEEGVRVAGLGVCADGLKETYGFLLILPFKGAPLTPP